MLDAMSSRVYVSANARISSNVHCASPPIYKSTETFAHELPRERTGDVNSGKRNILSLPEIFISPNSVCNLQILFEGMDRGSHGSHTWKRTLCNVGNSVLFSFLFCR